MTKEEIVADLEGISDGWQTTYEHKEVCKAMECYAEEVAVDYAYWLFERVFSKTMERPDREGRKLFSIYKEQKDKQ